MPYPLEMNESQQPDLIGGVKLPKGATQKCHPLRKEVIHQERWLTMERAHYQTPKGERSWEMVRRSHQSSTGPDGAMVIATLRRALHYDCIILIKQYRPTMGKYCIEFPAGLIDVNEDASSAALRELCEDTGYVGTVQRVSPGVTLDAGMSSSTVSMVHVNVDGDDPANVHPKQSLEEDEFIEVLVVPIHKLERKLQEWSEEDNLVIDSRLYVYASCQPAKKHSINRVENLSRKLDD